VGRWEISVCRSKQKIRLNRAGDACILATIQLARESFFQHVARSSTGEQVTLASSCALSNRAIATFGAHYVNGRFQKGSQSVACR
jgi:hypothetical protein